MLPGAGEGQINQPTLAAVLSTNGAAAPINEDTVSGPALKTGITHLRCRMKQKEEIKYWYGGLPGVQAAGDAVVSLPRPGYLREVQE